MTGTRSLRRGALGARGVNIMDLAVAYWKATEYSGSGALLDLSGRSHDAALGAGAAAPKFLAHTGPTEEVTTPILTEAVAYWKASEYSGSGDLVDLSGNGHDATFAGTAPGFLANGYDTPILIRDVAAVSHTDVSTATRATLGAILPEPNGGWLGGVLARNGKIYCVPREAADILIIDTVAGTATRSAMGATLTAGGEKWYGGCLARNGKIYCAPAGARQILIIDPHTETATLDDMGVDLTVNPTDRDHMYQGAVLGLDGRIYCMPYNAYDVLVIDPASGTAYRDDFGVDLTTSDQYTGGCLAPNGKIYCVPRNVSKVLILNPADQSAVLTNFGLNLVGNHKWFGACLGADGKIYCIPRESTQILIIDPATDTAVLSNMGATLGPEAKWYGGVVGPDGNIYGIPRQAADILIIDTVAQTATRSALGATLTDDTKWFSGVLGPDGNIYGVPEHSPNLLIISSPATPLPAWACESAYLNKV